MPGQGNGSGATLVTPSLLRDWPLPAPGADKYSRGSVLVIGGARSTPGAALLAGTAALRAGAGKLTLAVAASVAVQVGVALPECGALGLPETGDGSVTPDLSGISGPLDRADTVLVGPGLDDLDLAGELLQALLEREDPAGPQDSDAPTPSSGEEHAGRRPVVVLDAFALGALVPLEHRLDPWRGRLILTPNPTEAEILLGRAVENLEQDLAEVASRFGAVVSCQGLITQPPGDAGGPGPWKITTGYGGLGTSGSGDVLAGVIAGLQARGTTSVQAACWGTHLHAAAADRLASRLGPLGFMARELAGDIPALMLELAT